MLKKKLTSLFVFLIIFFFTSTATHAAKLFFPHIAAGIDGWQTELCVINDGNKAVAISFMGLSDKGQTIETITKNLGAYGRAEINVTQAFSKPKQIAYVVAESPSTNLCGYTKFFIKNLYRGSVKASSTANNNKIYIPHIASDHEWWTGIGILNTTGELIRPQIKFNNGRVEALELKPYEKKAFLIPDLVGNDAAADIKTAVIENAQGVIAFELFGTNGIYNDWCLSGISLDSSLLKTIYYPHIASDHEWWTGIVAYNPNGFDANITLKSYNNLGNLLQTKTGIIPAYGRLVELAKSLGLNPNAAWLEISSDQPLTGFELFGTVDGETLSGYECTNLGHKSGILPKIDHNGWTGIVFVNPGDSSITLTLDAIKNSGELIGKGSVTTVELAPRTKIVHLVPEEIADADYIRFQASGDVLSFQINGEEKMADAMAAISSSSSPTDPSSGVSVDEGVEKAMDMFASIMNMAPLAQEFIDIFEQILDNEDPNAPITIDPPINLDDLDLSNLPPNITMTLDCGTGYVTETGDTLTGKVALYVSDLAVEGSGMNMKIDMNARLDADDFRRNGDFLFNGEAGFDINIELLGFNLNIDLAMDMRNFETFTGLFDGGLDVTIPSLSLLSDTFPPATISFHEFKAGEFTINSGTVAMEPINEDSFALNLDLDTDFGGAQGTMEIIIDEESSALTVNTSNPITFSDYQVSINNVVSNPTVSLDFPISGNVVIVGEGETRTLSFTGSGYNLD